MNKFYSSLYKYLIEREKFYMKQYYSRFHSKNIYVAVREIQGGVYCVIVTDDKDENINISEALEYVKSLDRPFLFNAIVISDENYIDSNIYDVNKIVLNKENYNIMHCDNGCRPLAEIITDVIEKMKLSPKDNRKNYFKYKVSTLIIIALNIIMFLITNYMIYSNYSGSISEAERNRINNIVLIFLGAKYTPLIQEGEVWRLITCAFLHGSFIHIACNMYMLYIIGPEIEKIYGKVGYIIIYLVSCVSSSTLSMIINPQSISVGASGGIFGLMGALLAFALIERKNINKEYTKGLLKTIGINLIIGLVVINIDNAAHIGGFLGGVILGGVIYKSKKVFEWKKKI